MSSSPTEVTMPQMGVSVAEGTVVLWHKQPGDWVQADETICEITTDKIDSEVPAPASGRLLEILVQPEQTVPVGTPLALIATDVDAGEPHPAEGIENGGAVDAQREQGVEGKDAGIEGRGAAEPHPAESAAGAEPSSARAAAVEPAAAEPSSARAAAVEPAAVEPATPASASEHRHYSPVVQRIAEREGVALERVRGSGRGGRVRKQDVLAFVADRAASGNRNGGGAGHLDGNGQGGEGQAGGGGHAGGGRHTGDGHGEPPMHIESPYREEQATAAGPGGERLSRMRRTIAAHMVESLHTAAHCTSIVEADMSRIEAARRRLGLTYLPFVARCVIDALRVHPELNATLDGETLTLHREVHLGIAVSLERDGLIVPVIHDAHLLSHEGLAQRIAELAHRARAGELSADDVRGGTFTITNPGGYGTIASTPIINQPQVAILDLEAVVRRPVVVDDQQGEEAIAIRPITNLCLSWDHRALDGALAAQFLGATRDRIERWESS